MLHDWVVKYISALIFISFTSWLSLRPRHVNVQSVSNKLLILIVIAILAVIWKSK